MVGLGDMQGDMVLEQELKQKQLCVTWGVAWAYMTSKFISTQTCFLHKATPIPTSPHLLMVPLSMGIQIYESLGVIPIQTTTLAIQPGLFGKFQAI